MSVNILTSHSQSVNQVSKIKISCVGLFHFQKTAEKTADMIYVVGG